ncbi:MAG: hypothetical protein CVT94_14655 [Bacteroidetes bacterium HGW-Bacteroidetes-11]|nr:MAG: hypothetical protein CVT94_14655 [Bacteroidetes bacterium HGW-Bacteroidetes-11]
MNHLMMIRFLIIAFALLFGSSASFSQLISGGFTFDGLNRTYAVYLPASYQQNEASPLIMALHGLTQNGQSIMTFSGFNNIADTAGFVVVYPNGVSNSWNVGFSGGSTADDVGFLLALIDTLHFRYNIDYQRVYSTGFSNGGFMSYRLACEATDRIAAIAPVAGTMTDASYGLCQPSAKIPVLHIHGTSDFVVSYNGGNGNKSVDQVLALWNEFNNCPSTAVVENLPDLVAEGSTIQRHTWSPCDDGSEVMLLKIVNGGHTWPGSVGVTGIGITNRDIVASSEIWNFVKQFSRSGTGVGISEIPQKDFNVFPNPMIDGNLNITLPESLRAGSINISDLSGRLVFSKQITSGDKNFILNIPQIKSGYYLISITGSNFSGVRKLLIY